MTRNDRHHERARQDVPESVRSAYRGLGRAEPPDLLDQAVLNRARKAVAGAPASTRPWSFGWLHAVTTAAVVVLSVTLLLQLNEDERILPTRPAAPISGAPLAEPESRRSTERSEAAQPAAVRALPETPPDRGSQAEARSEFREPAADAPRAATPPLRTRDEGPEGQASVPATDEPRRDADIAVGTPESALAEIRALVEAGDLERARTALAEFRATWPRHAVPEDLLQALTPP